MTTVLKGVLNAIREKGLRPFLRELKEEGYAYVLSLSLSLMNFVCCFFVNAMSKISFLLRRCMYLDAENNCCI